MACVALANTSDASRSSVIGRYVHNETETWVLTSDHPIEFLETCDAAAVYDHCLPGRLGTFVYPLDVRFHRKDLPRTLRRDFDAAVREERAAPSGRRETAPNTHSLTVSQDVPPLDVFAPNKDGSSDEDDDEEEDYEDVEEEEDGAEPDGGGEALEEEELDSEDERPDA